MANHCCLVVFLDVLVTIHDVDNCMMTVMMSFARRRLGACHSRFKRVIGMHRICIWNVFLVAIDAINDSRLDTQGI